MPAIEDILIRSDSLDKVKDERVIDLIDVVRKFDSKQKTIKQIVNNQLLPLYENYLRKMNLD